MQLISEAEKFWPSFQLRYLLLLPVAAAIVHLIATFIAMSDTRGSAYARLGALPLNTMQILAPITPEHQPLPFLTSDARYAMCRFSSRQGPVTVKAVLPDRGWTLGVYSRDGSTAYFAAGSRSRTTQVAISIVPSEDLFLGLPSLGTAKAPVTNAQLNVAVREGLIVVRAPDRGAAYRQGDEQILAKASCSAQSF